MIMAAGLGSRLRPYSDRQAKPMLPLFGVPMIQYALDLLRAQGVKECVINAHHLSDLFKKSLLECDLGGLRIEISDESKKLLGSAGGVRKAIELLGRKDPFFLLNADVVADVDLSRLAAAHAKARKDHGACLTLMCRDSTGEPGAYSGMVLDPNTGLIRGYTEKKRNALYFASVAVVEPETYLDLPLDEPAEFIPSVLKPRLFKSQIAYDVQQRPWFDIGDPRLWWESHLKWMDLLRLGRLPERWKNRIAGLHRKRPGNAWVHHSVPDAVLQGLSLEECYLGEGFSGSHDSTLKRAVSYGASKGVVESESLAWNGVVTRFSST